MGETTVSDTKKLLQSAAESILARLKKEAPEALQPDISELGRVIYASYAYGSNPGTANTLRHAGPLTPITKANEAIQVVLEKNGSPMTRDEIISQLLDQGWGLDRANPAAAAKTALTLHLKSKRHARDWNKWFDELPDGKFAMTRWGLAEKDGHAQNESGQ